MQKCYRFRHNQEDLMLQGWPLTLAVLELVGEEIARIWKAVKEDYQGLDSVR